MLKLFNYIVTGIIAAAISVTVITSATDEITFQEAWNVLVGDGYTAYADPNGNFNVPGDLVATIGRGVVFSIAPSDAPTKIKNQADDICNGTNDHIEIQDALDTYDNVLLLPGTFSAGNITVRDGNSLVGLGSDATIIHINNSTDGIIVHNHGVLRGLQVYKPHSETYTGRAVSLVSQNSTAYTPSPENQLDDLYIDRGGEYDPGYGSNTGLYIAAIGVAGGTNWLTPDIGSITTRGWEKAVEVVVDATSGTAWMWGLSVESLVMYYPGYGVYFDWNPNGSLNNYLYYPTFDRVMIQANTKIKEGMHLECSYAQVKFYSDADMPSVASINITNVGGGINSLNNYIAGNWGGSVSDSGRDTTLAKRSDTDHFQYYGGKYMVSGLTANYTLSAAQSGLTCSNSNATANITITLPDSSNDYGMHYRFVVVTGNEIRIDPNDNGKLIYDDTLQAAGKYIYSDELGASVELIFMRVGAGDFREWAVVCVSGNWTMEL